MKQSPDEADRACPPILLEVLDLVAGYDRQRVVDRVSLQVFSGEIVALLGHNGAGKSTLLKSLFGLLPVWSGKITVDGEVLTDSRSRSPLDPRELLRHRIVYVPQGGRVFNTLTVAESLELAAMGVGDTHLLNERREYVLELFPALKNRLQQRAGTLSGGEKQMLALAGALMISPRLLLLDEPSLGLSPALTSECFELLDTIVRPSKTSSSKVSALIVEQKVRAVLRVAARVYVLRNGVITFAGSAAALEDETRLRAVYL